jgi:hypothetical protein
VVLSQLVSELDWGLNTYSKHLKIITTLMVRTLSLYKDYNSLLRRHADICVRIATIELRQ